jgi:hypothetical protein
MYIEASFDDNETYVLPFQLVNFDERTPIDLTDATFDGAVKASADDVSPIVDLSTSSRLYSPDPANGFGVLTILPGDLPPGSWLIDARYTIAGVPLKLLRGKLTVSKGLV